MSTLNVATLQNSGGTGTAATLASINGGPISGARNRVINGSMVLDQRNAGASVANGLGNTYYLDRWLSQASVASKFTVQQNAGSITPPAGFTNYIGVTSSSAYSISASDYFTIEQRIEGYNTADLDWGLSTAKAVTLSFWVRSSLTGTFGGALTNSAGTRSYPFTYTVSSANTWEQKAVTVSGDTTGTWLTTNGIGIRVQFGLGVGSSYSGTAGAWGAANYISATGATSVVGTNGATLYLTGVQLEQGTVATPFERRSYGQELALCQRYYQYITQEADRWATGTGVYSGVWWFKQSMRVNPSIAVAGVNTSNITQTSVTMWAAATGPLPSATASAEL